MSYYKELWTKLESMRSYPRYIRDICIMENERFLNLNELEILTIINNFYDGDIYIIQNVLTKEEATGLRKRIFDWGNSLPPGSHKILDECPNHHVIVDSPVGPAGGYESVDHAYYFFRWNDDPVDIFRLVDPFWRQLKVISGFQPNEFKNNLPHDKVVDRIRAIHYPLNQGYISSHVDTPKYQKIIGGITLTDKSTDGNYEEGGFYVLNKKEERVYLDEYATGPSALIFTSSMYHGVSKPSFKSVKGHKPYEESMDEYWNNYNLGRFQVALFSPESHHVEKRELALSIEQVKNVESN